MKYAAGLTRAVVVCGLMGTVLFGLAAPTRAGPELGAVAGPIPPPRDGDGEAPEREPVVVEQEVLPDGSIHTIVEMPAVADSYIASNRPTQNFGNDALFLGYDLEGDNFGAERILVRFDVAGFVPSQAIINSAELELYLVFSSPYPDSPMGTILRRTASSWGEYTVTWNQEPAWGEIRASADVGDVEQYYTWDVTGLIDDWLTGAQPNYGMEIIGDERVQERERAFYSREAAQNFPLLRVDYTVVQDTLPPIVTVNPLPDFSRRHFTVSWSGVDQGPAGIAYYDVQYRVDDGPWTDWQMGVTTTSAEFMNGENGRLYEFRARGVDNVGNVEPFGASQAATEVDTMPPVAKMNQLPAIIHVTSFPISWTGTDDGGSGIQYFDVRTRFDDGDWVPLLEHTILADTTFDAIYGDGLYAFEVRAVDNVGNVEAFSTTGEAMTVVDAVPPFVEPELWFPQVVNNAGLGRGRFAKTPLPEWPSVPE
jgi:hypothetical protein